MPDDLIAIILAGGEGTRLKPLTIPRGKPAVPFGGKYRIIDFAINNFINSKFGKISLLVQYESHSLTRHVREVYGGLRSDMGMYVACESARLGGDKSWYKGTADAVWQNMNIVSDENPEYVAIFSGDHIYKMDIRQMLDFHQEKAELTIAVMPKRSSEAAGRFGVIEVDSNNRIVGFEEKPSNPKEIPNQKGFCFVSMGNYIFNTKTLEHVLEDDAKKISISKKEFLEQVQNDPEAFRKYTLNDFGFNVIPHMTSEGHPIFACDFTKNRAGNLELKETDYWMDVGTIEDYYSANMDLKEEEPKLNIYPTAKWPIRTKNYDAPPSKHVHRDSHTINSLLCEGVILSNAYVSESVISPLVKCNSFSSVSDSIIFERCNIGRYARLVKVILDKGVIIENGTSANHVSIGIDHERDRQRGFTVSETGIVVVPRDTRIFVDGRVEFSEDIKKKM